MKYNYKLLIIDNNQFKYFKFDYINNINYFIRLNFKYIKLIIVLFLITAIKFQINKFIESNELEKHEIDNIQSDLNIFKPDIFWNYTYLKNEMHSYSLYNAFKSPKISLILMKDKIPQSNMTLFFDNIKSITSQNFTNLEIIFCLNNKKEGKYIFENEELDILLKEKIIRFFYKTNNIKEDFSNLINLINGYYAFFIFNMNILEYIKINQLYNYTKNNINNYINFKISNYSDNYYLFKTKILKDIIDNGIELDSFNSLLGFITKIPKPLFNYIPVSFCPDNDYSKLAYVSMSSILSSKASNTYICFYLIIPSDFENKNIDFLNSLYDEYDSFNISYIIMDNRYDKAYTDKRITKQAYYRFSLGELLINLNKIIYLDTDIIVYKDLSKFYNLNFNGKMILGQPTYGNKNSQKKGFHRINTGVMLLNLFEMRKNKFESKVIEKVRKIKKLKYHDQTLLNDYFKEFLGLFPPEYHSRPWSNYKEMEIFNKKIGNIYDRDYFYFIHKYPTIRHFLGKYKPINPNINHIEDWWFYARKSKYYNNNNSNSYKYSFSF